MAVSGSSAGDILSIKRHLANLKFFMESARQCGMNEKGLFVACLRASLAKAYDFAVFAENDAKEATAFFSMGALRSICEDIIVLKLVSTFNEADQKSVIMSAIQGPAFGAALQRQVEFFKLFRPGQPIKGRERCHRRILRPMTAIWQRFGRETAGRKEMTPKRRQLNRWLGRLAPARLTFSTTTYFG